jgi:hypothetical protein
MNNQNNNTLSGHPSQASEPFKITGDWYRQAKALQQTFPQLTDADLKFQTGKDEELLSRMVARLNQTRDAVMASIRTVRSGIPAAH